MTNQLFPHFSSSIPLLVAKVNLPSEVLGWNDGCLLWLDTWQFSKTWIPPQPHKPFHVHNLNETKKTAGPEGFTDHTTHQQKNTTSRHAEMLVPKLWSYCIPRNFDQFTNKPRHTLSLGFFMALIWASNPSCRESQLLGQPSKTTVHIQGLP